VRRVASGHRYLSAQISDLAIESFAQRVKSAERSDAGTLTAREIEVLRLSALGHSNADIANQLFLSQRTVETHRSNIMKKLDLHTQTELIHYAIRSGMVDIK
jgi:DNA-binding NarL/FixJ family response regulator